jgi:hypothetical protein
MAGAIKDWSALFSEAYRVLKPGGWIESGEFDPRFLCDDSTMDKAEVAKTWNKVFEEGGKTIGSSFTVIDENVQELGIKGAGFGEVQGVTYKVNTSMCTWGDVKSDILDCRPQLVHGQRIKTLQKWDALCSWHWRVTWKVGTATFTAIPPPFTDPVIRLHPFPVYRDLGLVQSGTSDVHDGYPQDDPQLSQHPSLLSRPLCLGSETRRYD